jgi:uncharacterized protein YndB with AHSA1/START domain
VTFKRRSRHSPARLWRAITDAAELAAWMEVPGAARVDLRAGGEYWVPFKADGSDALDGVVVKVEAERVLRYAWGRSVVEWEIEAEGDGCVYTFLQQGLAYRNIPDEPGLPAGWHGWLDMFDAYLDGASIPKEKQDADWTALQPAYRERLDAIHFPRPANTTQGRPRRA